MNLAYIPRDLASLRETFPHSILARLRRVDARMKRFIPRSV
jgi:hypothetical protein